mmetsp:Transcript_40728/g.74513  ORF Transcript_40728/g.74513 Transcript_40728/m.74513 type:complete len:255 (-) Transcript_40728:1010-1774(-)
MFGLSIINGSIIALSTILPARLLGFPLRLSNASSACFAMASICNIKSSSSNDSNFDGRLFRGFRGDLFFVVISNNGLLSSLSNGSNPLTRERTDRIDLVERRDRAVAKVSSSLSSSPASTAMISTLWSANMSSMLAVISYTAMLGVILKLVLAADTSAGGASCTAADSIVISAASLVASASSSKAMESMLPATETSPAIISSSTSCNFLDKCSSFWHREVYLLFSFPSLVIFADRFALEGGFPNDAPLITVECS